MVEYLEAVSQHIGIWSLPLGLLAPAISIFLSFGTAAMSRPRPVILPTFNVRMRIFDVLPSANLFSLSRWSFWGSPWRSPTTVRRYCCGSLTGDIPAPTDNIWMSVMVDFCQRVFTACWHQPLITVLFSPGLGQAEAWSDWFVHPKQS